MPTGTSGPYPYLLAESGDIDITGHRRTISYFREIVFGLRSEPVHRGAPPAAPRPSDRDDPVVMERHRRVVDAGTCQRARRSSSTSTRLPTRSSCCSTGHRSACAPVGADKAFRAGFETRVASRRAGRRRAHRRRRGRRATRCARPSATRRSSPSPKTPRCETDGLGFIAITIEDAVGTVFVDADRLVTVTVEGPGVLAGLGTGRARTEEPFAGPSVTTYDGRALAIVRPTGPGAITVTVEASGPTRRRRARRARLSVRQAPMVPADPRRAWRCVRGRPVDVSPPPGVSVVARRIGLDSEERRCFEDSRRSRIPQRTSRRQPHGTPRCSGSNRTSARTSVAHSRMWSSGSATTRMSWASSTGATPVRRRSRRAESSRTGPSMM